MKNYDIILIGTGQATGTIIPELLKEKKSIAVIEGGRVGGTCVNWGCTPTKTLIASARAAKMAQRGAFFGIDLNYQGVAFDRVMERVNDIRNNGSDGFRAWLEEVTDFYPAWATFVDEHTVKAGDTTIRGEIIIIHTGAHPRKPDIPGINSVHWLDNRGILDLKSLPEHLLIIGGSYIGLEFGQAFRRLGSKVSIFEHGERLTFREDPEISALAKDMLSAEEIAFHFNSRIISLSQDKKGINLLFDTGNGEEVITGSHILVATGRIPSTEQLNLKAAGIQQDQRGYIEVDNVCRTSVNNIFALGDVNGMGAFTHTSVHDGQVFLDHYFNRGDRKISDRIPVYAMYIDPPLARVGMNRQEAERSGKAYLTGRMEMSSVSRAKEKGETGGVMEIIVEKESNLILGATLFGVGSDEIIGMIALAMQAKLPWTKLQETVIPHPTVSELVPWLFSNLKEPQEVQR